MTTNTLSPAEQIAAINRKRADDHRRVDMQHDQLIQVVRERCLHEPANRWSITCKYCGELLPGTGQ